MKKIRVALLADYREEGWTSMDLVAEMTVRELARHANIEVEHICPKLPLTFSSMFGSKARNADRLLGRFLHYPESLKPLLDSFDLFHVIDHSYAHLAHYLPAERCLVSCHDLDAFRCLLPVDPEPRPWWLRRMANRTLRGMQKAAHVPCGSIAVYDELLATGWIDPSRLSVVHHGVSPEFFAPPDPEAQAWASAWLGERGLTGQPWILHVGSTIPRKRIPDLIDILARLRTEFPQLQLVRVGGGLLEDQAALADQLGVLAAIHKAPFLTRPQLRALYSQTLLLLQPSSYEGFGLPIAEAQACGAIVVASDLPVLREVGGAAAAYAPVGAVEIWKKQVSNLLQLAEKQPGAWEERKRLSRQQAEQFRWEHTAAKLVYRYQYTLGLLD